MVVRSACCPVVSLDEQFWCACCKKAEYVQFGCCVACLLQRKAAVVEVSDDNIAPDGSA